MKKPTKIFLILSLVFFALTIIILSINLNFGPTLLLTIISLIASVISQFISKRNARFFLYVAIFISLISYYYLTKFVFPIYALIAAIVLISIFEFVRHTKLKKHTS